MNPLSIVAATALSTVGDLSQPIGHIYFSPQQRAHRATMLSRERATRPDGSPYTKPSRHTRKKRNRKK